MSIRVETWGEYALFTRPEMKVERASYDVMTPSAARGILEAIFWHPGLKWQVDKIFVRAPIRFLNLRRNEVKATVNARSVKTVMNRGEGDLWISAPDEIQQRAALLLRDVRYIIEAHFDMTDPATRDNPGKFQDIMKRRIQKGQFYHQPYFGCREFPVSFRRWPGGPIPTIDETRDLGLMLYDFDYSDPAAITPTYFRARLEHGVLNTQNCEVFR